MFTRTIQLIGEDSFRALQNARVILFGVGGVGGWCAETLLRTGIGHLTLVDFDKVDTTNLNRQVVATHENIGQSKVVEMQKRLLSICPQLMFRPLTDNTIATRPTPSTLRNMTS